MPEALINGGLVLTHDDGISVMSKKEALAVFHTFNPSQWAAHDPERRIVIAIEWQAQRIPFLSAFVTTSAKDVAQRVEEQARKSYKLGYSGGELYTRELCGTESWGFRYEYLVQGVEQVGQVDVVTQQLKKGSCCYTIYFHSRKEDAEENYARHEAMLASMHFV